MLWGWNLFMGVWSVMFSGIYKSWDVCKRIRDL